MKASSSISITIFITVAGLVYSSMRLNLSRAASDLIHFTDAVIWSGVLCILRFTSTKYVLMPLGEYCVSDKGKGKHAKISKFATCLFKAAFFVVICYFEYSILSKQDFTPSWLFGSGVTSNLWTENYEMPYDMIALFMASLGYHLHSTIYHCFFVERRGDFGEMLLHHALTLWLMVLSYIEGYHRIGLLIVFLNDVPDIFVYLTKALGDTVYVKSSVVAYGGLVVTYFYFRLVVFPVSLLPSLLFEAGFSIFGRFIYIGFLCSLTLLHAYWFTLIVKIGVNLARTGNRRDLVVDRKGD